MLSILHNSVNPVQLPAPGGEVAARTMTAALVRQDDYDYDNDNDNDNDCDHH